MDKTDKSITDVSFKVFLVSHSWIWIFLLFISGLAYFRFGSEHISAPEYICLPEISFLRQSKFWCCHLWPLKKVKTFLLRGDRTLSFPEILKQKNVDNLCFSTISIWKFVYRILGKYLEIWMFYLLTQLGPVVDPKQIKLDQVHLACRTQLWNLRNSGNTKIF